MKNKFLLSLFVYMFCFCGFTRALDLANSLCVCAAPWFISAFICHQTIENRKKAVQHEALLRKNNELLTDTRNFLREAMEVVNVDGVSVVIDPPRAISITRDASENTDGNPPRGISFERTIQQA